MVVLRFGQHIDRGQVVNGSGGEGSTGAGEQVNGSG